MPVGQVLSAHCAASRSCRIVGNLLDFLTAERREEILSMVPEKGADTQCKIEDYKLIGERMVANDFEGTFEAEPRE